mmetsp:Transcript_92991/g.259947  ORF Transcript_92991/g.259947 Transcript_92991/m.259947 type:complete len:209 (-) Transcript_92991:210-836(-)
MEVVHQPTEERHGVLLLAVELLRRGFADRLVELVRGHQALEVPGVVHLPQQLRQTTQHWVALALLRRLVREEVISQRCHLAEKLHDDVLVVRVADVVHADAARDVVGAVQRLRIPHPRGHLLDLVLVERRRQVVLDVLQGLVHHLVAVGYAEDLAVLHVHPDVVALLEGVPVGIRLLAPALEVLAIDEVHIDILAGQRHRAQLFEVEV